MQGNLSIVDRLGYSTVRIECKMPNRRISTGTGFFFDVQAGDSSKAPAIITNWHIIEGSEMGRLRFTTARGDGSPDNGNYFTFDLYGFEKRWLRHPDPDVDLCIMPLAPVLNEMKRQGVNIYSAPFNRSHIPAAGILSEMRAVEDIVMIGYPNGLWDKTNNLPIFRKGITATHPRFHYNGREEFLIDAACFPGSSGSPVLHVDTGNYVRSGMIFQGDHVMLLGVLYAAPQYTISGDIEIVNVPTAQKPMAVSRIPNNLGVVINAEKLLDFENVLKTETDELSGFMVFHSAARRRSRSHA